MRTLDGEQVLARIFVGESHTWHRRPLHDALVERLRTEGFAGATMFRGIAGFGASSVLHATHILALSDDLPIVIEVVDSAERMERLTAILDEMMPEGLVTMETVRVIRYAPSNKNSKGNPVTET